MTPVFIDTNVLVYRYDRDAGGKHETARRVVLDLARARTAAISVQVMQEFVATTRRNSILVDADLRTALTIMSHWLVHRPGPDDVVAALDLSARHTLSFWDAMIVRSAVESGATTLLTEDLNPGQIIDGVTVVNPFAA
ncbi:MAG: PIN domain-containing protein [Propionibacteriaceae bacterium]|jgi:predicted nucleic acid-binding protein|nr:PIN domain-containing protein [Propionibacteriaceae bacterium]